MIRLLITAIFCVCLMSTAAQARTVYCVNCSNRFMQALDRVTNVKQLSALWKQYSEDIKQTAHQVRMVQQNVEQYANMVYNTVTLPSDTMNMMVGDFTRLAGYVNKVSARTGEINGMKDLYNAFYQKKHALNGIVSTANGASKYSNMLDRWTGEVDRATEATFKMTGNQLLDLEENGELEAHIRTLLSTPKGRMEAIQAGNKLTAIHIQESQQARAMMATYYQQQIAVQQKAEKKIETQEAYHQFLITPHRENPFKVTLESEKVEL